MSVVEKVQKAAEQWQKQAEEIQEGKRPHLWDILNERGYVKDVAG
jgi:tyrosyl-tRNA synthetase